jgi:hypothetical protein
MSSPYNISNSLNHSKHNVLSLLIFSFLIVGITFGWLQPKFQFSNFLFLVAFLTSNKATIIFCKNYIGSLGTSNTFSARTSASIWPKSHSKSHIESLAYQAYWSNIFRLFLLMLLNLFTKFSALWLKFFRHTDLH